MLVYTITGDECVQSHTGLFRILVRQDPNNDNWPDFWVLYLLSDLEDTPENRMFLTLKHNPLSILTVDEYWKESCPKFESSAEEQRFRYFFENARDYLQNQLTD